MSYRVLDTDVKQIFSTDMDTTPFIRTAHVLIENTLTPTGRLDEDVLREIELWLSAHFACLRDPIGLRTKLGEFEQWSFAASVTTAWGKGLDQTVYGQNAKALDTTGTLANLSSGKQKATFRVAPRENSQDFNRGID